MIGFSADAPQHLQATVRGNVLAATLGEVAERAAVCAGSELN